MRAIILLIAFVGSVFADTMTYIASDGRVIKEEENIEFKGIYNHKIYYKIINGKIQSDICSSNYEIKDTNNILIAFDCNDNTYMPTKTLTTLLLVFTIGTIIIIGLSFFYNSCNKHKLSTIKSNYWNKFFCKWVEK